MLPSTGYFKSIICPFYENGSCDRPYCHFKHLRRDDSTSSSAALPASQGQTAEAIQKSETSAVAAAPPDKKAKIHQLVNEAVMKLFESQGSGNAEEITDKIVAQVVEQLKPTIVANSAIGTSAKAAEAKIATSTIGKHSGVPSCVTKPSACVYNPTPISELKKRHIPVPVYMPTRESKVAVKRKSSTDAIIKPWSSCMLRESTNSHVSEMTYKPTAIVNISQDKDTSSSKTYVPTLRSDNSSSNSYEDGNSNDYMPKAKEAYYPKSKKRREEYVPRKVKAPLKSVQHLDDTVLDDFEPEFDMIDEILTSTTTAATTITTTLTTTTINADQTILINDDSVDMFENEPKFSDDDDDIVEEVLSDTPSAKELQCTKINTVDEALDDIEENENSEYTKNVFNHSNKKKSHKSASHKTDNISEKSSSGSKSKEKSRRNSIVNSGGEEKEKRKERRDSSKSDSKKENSESRKKEHKSSSKSHERSKSKDVNEKSVCKDRHKSTRDKSRSSSSSNKHRDKSKDSHSGDTKKDSSNRGKDTSRTVKEKVPSSKSDDNKSRDKTRHETKQRSSSSTTRTKTEGKSESHRSTGKKRSSCSSSHKTSKTSEKKTRKESSSEASFVEQDDRSNSPLECNLSNEKLMDISDSDHDVEEECLKIFQEYEPSDHPKGVTLRDSTKHQDKEEIEDVGRKRVAHPSAVESIVRSHGPSQPPKKIQNPQQRMYDRWRTMKDAAAEKSAERAALVEKLDDKAAAVTSKSTIPIEIEKTGKKQRISSIQESSGNTMARACNPQQVNGNGANRIRIAHVPYAMALALKKKKVNETKAANDAKAAALEAKTAAQTSKGSRVAHIPQMVPQLVAPEPLQVATQKFPLNVRQYYVNLMHVICVQIYTNGEDAAQRALREELACHDRCKALPVYKNSCMLATHRLRKEVEQGTNGDESLPSASGIVSHNSILAGKSKGSWSVEKTKKSVMDFRGVALYERLKKWIASEEQLRDNGFPRSHPDGPNGRAKVYAQNTRNHSILSKVPNERYCCRCGKLYTINKHGLPVQQQNCIYHWGRKFTSRGESKYTCCQQYGFASGCADAKNHVWEYVDYENLRGYVKTLPRDVAPEEQGVYALDCEMSYTTQGLELTRVTVINEDCNTIYETLVMPENPIIDYNTRFSGITEENMKGVTTTLLDVQATLLTMFSENTILVGHSLESDFKALKLIHDTVVDTSIMFPHKNGLPHKRALRNLCSEYLRKIIQNEVGGHDSTEDAVACMDLIHWKVKEEAKLQ